MRLYRKAYHKAKHLNNKFNTEETKNALIHRSREYKKEVKKANAKHKRQFINNLRNLKSSNPKLYWNILQDKSKDKSPVTLHDFYQHFKNVSQNPGETQHSFQDIDPHSSNPSNLNLNYDSLNAPFTEDELLARIRNLKNGKAAGNDYIINEFIKHSAKHLMPLYLILFNRILHEGRYLKSGLSA